MVDPLVRSQVLDEKLRVQSQDTTIERFKRLQGGADMDEAKARKTAQEFEAYFLYQLVKGMREAYTEGDSLFEGEGGGGFQGDVYKEMLDEEFGRTMASSGGVGVADMVLKSLGLSTREVARRLPPAVARGLDSYAQAPSLVEPSHQAPSREGILLTKPVPGSITSAFGTRVDPITGRLQPHEGLDLRAAEGEPVRAAASGIVLFAGEKPGYGRMVEILHADGFTSLYAHLSGTRVERGEFIERGRILGEAGETGRSTGPHLHLEFKRNGTPLDPTPYLRNV
ncbi:MAG: peptidoglycan DD-metalloendopeptidase family protein [Nitrospirae bacterium]|nr:peptidoglycan DD-metalloendopeptidase family protein [Nitrospirota bacterium]